MTQSVISQFQYDHENELTEMMYGLTWTPNYNGESMTFLHLHIPKVLSLVQVNVSFCEQKNLHTDLTEEQTQNPSPGSCS
jgi:hypothetical protein